MMDWYRQAPNSIKITVIIVCGVIATAILGAYTLMTLNGVDTTEFRQWINTLGQILVFPLLGISATASVAAAQSARKTEENSNGLLTRRDKEIETLKAKLDEKETGHGNG